MYGQWSLGIRLPDLVQGHPVVWLCVFGHSKTFCFDFFCYQIVPNLVKVNMSRWMSESVACAALRGFHGGDSKLGPMGFEWRVCRVWVIEVPEG